MGSAGKDERRIGEMRNLGPACERDLKQAGITTAHQLKKLGAEAAFIKMLAARKERGESMKCCNAAYLYALFGLLFSCLWTI